MQNMGGENAVLKLAGETACQNPPITFNFRITVQANVVMNSTIMKHIIHRWSITQTAGFLNGFIMYGTRLGGKTDAADTCSHPMAVDSLAANDTLGTDVQ